MGLGATGPLLGPERGLGDGEQWPSPGVGQKHQPSVIGEGATSQMALHIE